MKKEKFDKLRPYLQNKNRLTGRPGWYTIIAEKFNRSEVWVQKAAKDQDGLHSDELDEEIVRLAMEGKRKKQRLIRSINLI